MSESWYEIRNVQQLDTPALIIFKDRVKQNIQTAIRMVGDPSRLRPHIKTNKSPDAVRMMMEQGIYKFKCATIAEAELLGRSGAKDVLLAYQLVGPKLQRFIALIKKFPGTKFACLADNAKAAAEQSKAFYENGLTVAVYMDLNVGMNRTGIVPGTEATALYVLLSSSPGIIAAGIHAYDGHIRDTDFEKRKNDSNLAYEQVTSLKNDLEQKGFLVPAIVAGGSPSFPVHGVRNNCECSPGTFIYWDKTYSDCCPEQDFQTAAVLVTRIISLPTPSIICTDLGHKSVAPENEIHKRIFFLNATNLRPISQSEEHLVLESPEGHSYKTGDLLYGLPYHICPTVALYERSFIVTDGMVSGEWMHTARDRKISI